MISTTEVLKRSPLWIIKFIYIDMQKFSHLIISHYNYKGEILQGDVDGLRQITDPNIRQLVNHLNATTRCLLNYAYVNYINIMDLKKYDKDYFQAKTTWDIIFAAQLETIPHGSHLLDCYGDRSELYSLLLWNCAQQILMNKVDVYNDTIDEFILRTDYSKYNDERTQPLFKLLTILLRFHINLPYS
jgi:hypothetical protein